MTHLSRCQFPPGRGQWSLCPDGIAVLRCGGTCNALIGVRLPVHTIRPDGTVIPSFVCPLCGWHVFITLDGYGVAMANKIEGVKYDFPTRTECIHRDSCLHWDGTNKKCKLGDENYMAVSCNQHTKPHQ